ncbi:hypothetical protein L202_01013 [Cryptococcus amylolentus CBS 6039]|uniref:VanZ-like domain-containing protein n=1 Tax=Cryptococcus amylolentus CBS 6039 TaxID=1295533 RepID=A0A1E3I2E9_9TREE|nr:hypothetical protein L202_01013 [Cryptococcus amylolentus CBS 6039]ODN82729.1 hypothetical protein L202_01013 [Cryptococcus amylolentus CBS 6039]
MPATYPVPTKVIQELWDKFTTWVMRSYPIRDYPLNLRPAMVFATAAWIILLGILGMAPLPELPVNDKALHFFGLGFATFLLYFVIDVPEGPGRRVWYIRRAPLIVVGVLAFFIGGIVSEFVQATLPWKTFQPLDILSNLLGSSLFLYLAHLAHLRHLKKQEILSLYQPLSAGGVGRYRDAQGREHRFEGAASPVQETSSAAGVGGGRGSQGVIWDEESETGSRASDDGNRGGEGGTGTGYGGAGLPVFRIDDEDDALTPGNRPGGVQLS